MTEQKSSLELRLLSLVAIAYLGMKLILVPGIGVWRQTTQVNQPSRINLEIAPTDLVLVLIILGFSPSASQLFRSLRVNSQGFQAEFKGVEKTIEEKIIDIHKV